MARNKQGTVTATSKVKVAGPASIVVPPRNVTNREGDRTEFICEAKGLPTYVTHQWFHNGVEISQLPWMETRTVVRRDGTLFINPTTAEDSGKFTCEVTNGIGTPDTASAFLTVEYPARVLFAPTVQYLPVGLSGVIRCYVQASPPFQSITWTKESRQFDPNAIPGVVTLNNGSLLFQRVNRNDQGRYQCTPYNVHGTAGTSNVMDVLVIEPPMYTLKPKEIYQKPVDSEIKLHCEGVGQPKPAVTWRRADRSKLPRERALIRGGNLTIRGLKKEDHGRYECVLKNEIATLVASTLLLVERTTPHAPTNVTVNTSIVAATLTWLPAYDGGHEQTYVIWYRLADQGDSDWQTIRVYPDEATTFTVYNLQADTEYDFQVLSRNKLGDGMFSLIIRAKTKSADYVGGSGGIVTTTPLPPSTSPFTPSGEKSSGNSDAGYLPEEPKRFTAIRGEDVILFCGFEFPENKPLPYVIQWYKQGIKIPIYIWYDGFPPHSGVGYEGRLFLAHQASLNLTNVHETDQGWYECRVFFLNRPPDSPTNGTWVHLDVYAPLHFKMKPLDVVYVKVGESVSLPCEAEGTPPPNLIWYKDNLPLEENRRVQILPTELRINNLRQTDIGDYTCMARNEQGTVTATSKVIVAEPPMYTLKPKEIYQKRVDSEIKLPCQGVGQPKPAVTWQRADGSKLPRERALIRGGNLTIRGLKKKDRGRYECVLENEIATLVTSTLLLVESTAHGPTNVTVNTSSVAATLNWLPAYERGQMLFKYGVRYRVADQDDTDWQTVNFYRTITFTVYNLQAETEYDFQVLSRNKLGNEMFSLIVRAKTKS